MADRTPSGPRGDAPGPGPVLDPEEVRRIRFRGDRMIGIMLFVVGVAATVVHMASVTESGLAEQGVLAFQTYGLGDYVRPESLAGIGVIGLVLHPLNYAVWLYIALLRWRKRKFAAWCAVVGAVTAVIISVVIMTAALAAHPEVVEWAQRGISAP
ncbi:DUF6264 family protein [Gulosibacter sp. 10]|uniref:DUF6264 family protein n=1 Tax=Gulosibacter sp. 10 TaxID=1255570 RepID=UPI0020CEC79F|nr:DUF6264 family protein [Gulosibacter sp. 10]